MSMSKKDFIVLADSIREHHKRCTYGEVFTEAQIKILANFCQSQNPRFDRERWLGYIRGENGPSGRRVK